MVTLNFYLVNIFFITFVTKFLKKERYYVTIMLLDTYRDTNSAKELSHFQNSIGFLKVLIYVKKSFCVFTQYECRSFFVKFFQHSTVVTKSFPDRTMIRRI